MADLGKVISGARTRFKLDGVPVMYGTNVTFGEEIRYDPVEVLDLLEVAEHVPIGYTVTFSAQFVRVVTKPIKNRDGVVIFPKLADILSSGELTGAIEDSVTGTVLANVERVKASRYSNNIGARGIVLTDVEFVAIRIKDEEDMRA
jgi:hypothetical protein